MGLPRKIKNFALFHDGVSYAGQVEEATLPKLTRKTEEWRSGGMGGPIKADMGMDGIEMEWTAGGVLREVLNQFGTLKHDGVMLRFAGALQADDSEEIQTLEVVVRGRHTEVDFGNTKAGDKTAFKVKNVCQLLQAEHRQRTRDRNRLCEHGRSGERHRPNGRRARGAGYLGKPYHKALNGGRKPPSLHCH